MTSPDTPAPKKPHKSDRALRSSNGAKHGWTPERRARQAENIRQTKPWTKSTGPRTETGKTISAYNAYKHGLHSRAGKKLEAALNTQRRFIASIEALVRFEKNSRKRTEERKRTRALMYAARRAARKALNPVIPAVGKGGSAANTLSPVIPAVGRSDSAANTLPPVIPAVGRSDSQGQHQQRGSTKGAAKPHTLFSTQPLQFTRTRPINRPMWTVAALYRFVELTDLPRLQADIKAACEANGICGTLLIAPEGINGTIGGVGEKLDKIIAVLDRLCGVSKGELKYSTSTGKPFLRMKVRMKKEIITMAAPEADPTKLVGMYVEPEDWNALIADPDVTLIDTRNDYETAVGIFKGAIDPNIQKFTDFKQFVAEKMDPAKQKKVAMFCTGGIRCEKASSYMLAHGFEEVYHLKGGILKYLETVPADQSQWDGECFVFDRRVAVGHGLTEGVHDICYGCRFPLKEGDKLSAAYEEGVSCPRCYDALTPHKADALRMRHSQFKKDEILQG